MLDKKIKILSIDPGTSYLGIARSEYDLTTGIFTVLQHQTVEGRRVLTKNKELTAVYSARLIQLEAIREEIEKIARTEPDYIVVENAFHQPGRTPAYAALLLCIHVIEIAIKNTLNKPVYKMAPRLVKQLTTQSGDASKDTVQDAILHHPNIVVKETKASPLSGLTQHSADAIAIGYAFCIEVLPGQG